MRFVEWLHHTPTPGRFVLRGRGVLVKNCPLCSLFQNTQNPRRPNNKAQPRAESGSYSLESSYQFKYLDRPANDPIVLNLLALHELAALEFPS